MARGGAAGKALHRNTKATFRKRTDLECNCEVFQQIVIEVLFVKEQQELKHTPVREQI